MQEFARFTKRNSGWEDRSETVMRLQLIWDLFSAKIDVGYAYDFTTTDLGNYSTGTHELILGVRFNRTGLKKSDGAAPQFN